VTHGDKLPLGKSVFEVRHVPGHSSGSVIYYCQEIHSAFVGDLIFYHSVGRTDLEDGDGAKLVQSIQSQILTLPNDTILYPGHGPATTVAEEVKNNPYI
jgi:glyoxylase-like metal-dependent hydrolase (beta-lactamase superfamily II)